MKSINLKYECLLQVTSCQPLLVQATLEEKDELLRQRDREILEVNRQLRELQRQLREVTDTAEQLRNRLAAKEEECLEKDREIEVRPDIL